jgi:homoserine acetyltransferase
MLATFDLTRDRVVCVNALGSCHGSTGPASIDPTTRRAYGKTFPRVDLDDQARFLRGALASLGLERFDAAIGCSMGGQLVLKLLEQAPALARRYVVGAAAEVPCLTRLINGVEIKILEDGDYTAAALTRARELFRLHCAAVDGIEQLQHKLTRRNEDVFAYFAGDGEAFATWFSPVSFARLLQAINDFRFAAAGLAGRLEPSQAVHLVSLTDDYFTPAAGVAALAQELEAAGVRVTHETMSTSFGHEAWLIEADRFCRLVQAHVRA